MLTNAATASGITVEIGPPRQGSGNLEQQYAEHLERLRIFPHEGKILEAQERYGNKDLVGWLYVPGTDIDGPVALGEGLEYENMTLAGKKVKAGPKQETALFYSPGTVLLSATLFSKPALPYSRNIVIYGHNWTNVSPPFRIGKNDTDSGFAELQSYTDLTFLNNNPHIYTCDYASEYHTDIRWRVACVMYTDTSNTLYYQPHNFVYGDADARAPAEEKYEELLKGLKEWSMFEGVDLESNDILLTLSTCTRATGDSKSQRLVVVARRLRNKEYETDKVVYTAKAKKAG
jgi:sortase B